MFEQKSFSPSLNYLSAQYFESLQLRNLSKLTIKSYTHMLNRFLRFLENIQVKNPEEITRKVLSDYQLCNSQDKNIFGEIISVSSQNCRLKAPISFCKFLYENDYIKDDPTKGIKYPKKPKILPRNIPTEEELVKILNQPDLNRLVGFRDRTILEVLYSCGMRKSELINLDVSDVDYKQGMIMIRQGKGAKDRYVPVGRIACQFLEAYINHVRRILLKGSPNQALFVSQEAKRICSSALANFIRKYTDQAGVKKKITPHSFRHACATHLVNRGLDIRHVQALLGHSCLMSTQIYTRVGIEDLKKIIQKHHPREKNIHLSSIE